MKASCQIVNHEEDSLQDKDPDYFLDKIEELQYFYGNEENYEEADCSLEGKISGLYLCLRLVINKIINNIISIIQITNLRDSE